MPSSILPQNHDEQELYNAISSFFYKFHLGNLSCAMYSPTEACICSRKQALTKKHFQKILFIAL